MKQVQPATKEQQLLSSLIGKLTNLYMQDISEVTPNPVGLIKKEALFNGLGNDVAL